jgi:transposase
MFKDYNMNQLILPLDLEVKLQENDIAFSIHHLVESIPSGAFDSFLRPYRLSCSSPTHDA